MKKITLLILLFASTFAIAQEKEEEQEINVTQGNFNEIKLNAAYLIAGAFDVLYERTINEESAFGVSLFIPFDEGLRDDYQFSISPYYRFYFGDKFASGFFAEGFGILNSTRDEFYNFNTNNYIYENNTDFGLGIAVGGKWVTKRGVVFEIFGGVARNLFNNNDRNFEIIGKGGISVGYRF